MRRALLFLPLSLLLFPFTANTQQPSNDCSLSFKGSHRKAVKNRTKADGADYEIFREGQPISINEWFSLTCSLDAPTRIPATKPIEGVETITVTLEGFLVGFKFERNRKAGDGKDNDLHLEIAPSKRWNTRHVIAEVPPGQAYCEARNKVWRFQQADGSGGDSSRDRHIFNRQHDTPDFFVLSFLNRGVDQVGEIFSDVRDRAKGGFRQLLSRSVKGLQAPWQFPKRRQINYDWITTVSRLEIF